MSYDLYVHGAGAEAPDWDRFEAHFTGRPRYSLNARAREVLYENPDTGVYFVFSFHEGDEQGDPDFPVAGPHVAFNINYVRPSFFALEAAPELAAAVAALGGKVHDPQMQGMGDGPFSEDGFLRGWEAGNAFGVGAFKAHGMTPEALLPRDTLHAVWRWNRDRAALALELEIMLEDAFVPQLMVFEADGVPAAPAFVWPDGISIVVPAAATHAAIGLGEAKKRILGVPVGKPRPKRSGLVPVGEIEARISLIEDRFGPFQVRRIKSDPETPPPEVRELLSLARSNAVPVKRIAPFDKVLDAELFQTIQ